MKVRVRVVVVSSGSSLHTYTIDKRKKKDNIILQKERKQGGDAGICNKNT